MAEYYIDRASFVGELIQKQFENKSDKITISEVIRLANSQPKVGVVEVKHGNWKNSKVYTTQPLYTQYCSKCGKRRFVDNYCSNCGAKMDGDDNA